MIMKIQVFNEKLELLVRIGSHKIKLEMLYPKRNSSHRELPDLIVLDKVNTH